MNAVMTQSKPRFAIKTALVSGASADTDIAIAGILTTDTIVGVLELVGAGVDVTDATDRTATTSITSDGNIQVSVATTGDKLWVLYSANDL